jgi:hypothetical protein
MATTNSGANAFTKELNDKNNRCTNKFWSNSFGRRREEKEMKWRTNEEQINAQIKRQNTKKE